MTPGEYNCKAYGEDVIVDLMDMAVGVHDPLKFGRAVELAIRLVIGEWYTKVGVNSIDFFGSDSLGNPIPETSCSQAIWTLSMNWPTSEEQGVIRPVCGHEITIPTSLVMHGWSQIRFVPSLDVWPDVDPMVMRESFNPLPILGTLQPGSSRRCTALIIILQHIYRVKYRE